MWEHFNTLLGTSKQCPEALNLDYFYQSAHVLSGLDAPISEQEVWEVVKNIALDKASGPDGFTGRFYKSCWGTIKQDIMATIGALHGGDTRKLHLLNSSYMVLIPKKKEPTLIGDYRLISLVHSFAKLLTKVLANRLSPRLGTIVALNQSTFICGRCIHDNFLLVKHIAKFLHGRGKPQIRLKLDITKAFDSISWAFLLEVLRHLGFGQKWRSLLCDLLFTSSTQVLLNGEPGQPIRHRRGLRQGDPLSPMLFIMAMDVLTRLIAKAEELHLFEPLANRAIGHRISIYADDVVMFCSTKPEDLALIKTILEKFGNASGLRTNMLKSSIVPIRCVEANVEVVKQHMDCSVTDFPCKYLGLPLSITKLTRADLQPILDKIADKLPGWKATLMA